MLPLSRVSFGAISAFKGGTFNDSGLLHDKYTVYVNNQDTPDFDTFQSLLDPKETKAKKKTGKLTITGRLDYPDRVTINSQTQLDAKAETLLGQLVSQSGNADLQKMMIQRAVAFLSDRDRMTPANLLDVLTTKVAQFSPKA